MKIGLLLTLLALLGGVNCAEDNVRGLCHYCKCPVRIEKTHNIVNCRSVSLKDMPPWDLAGSDEVYLIMKFQFNHFEKITQDMIPRRPDVYQMFFDNNNISLIGPQAFCHLPELKYLSLSGNKLEKINENAFKSCNGTGMQLLHLDLSLNKLHSLDDDLFDDLHELLELNLNENDFVAIDTSTSTALNKLHNLDTLHLARNRLKEINSGISTPIKTLVYLNLAGNDLSSVPSVLKYAERLTDLNINDNPIPMIHETDFVGLTNLRVLNMSMMSRLGLIDKKSFEPLVSLSEWRCSINYDLRYIHPDMFGKNKPKNLVTVDLSQNNLSTLDKNVLGWWEGQNLNMQKNPLFCDCHLVWLKFRKTDPELIQDVTCEAGPTRYKDQRLIDLPEAAILCEAPPNNFISKQEDYAIVAAVVSITLFTVIVVAIAIVAILRARKTPNWTTVRYTKAKENEYY